MDFSHISSFFITSNLNFSSAFLIMFSFCSFSLLHSLHSAHGGSLSALFANIFLFIPDATQKHPYFSCSMWWYKKTLLTNGNSSLKNRWGKNGIFGWTLEHCELKLCFWLSKPSCSPKRLCCCQYSRCTGWFHLWKQEQRDEGRPAKQTCSMNCHWLHVCLPELCSVRCIT